MKECFVITSFCETEDKVKILNNTIDNIKKFDKDIMIHAHFPLSPNIQNKVNYYISSENFIIDNKMKVSWFITYKDNYKLCNYQTNYNYTVIKQFIESILLLFSIGYDVIHHLHYDSNITNDIYLKTKEYCYNNSVFYQSFFDKNQVIANWFSINKKNKDLFIKIFSYNAYISSPDYSIEKYIGNYINKTDIKIIGLEQYNHLLLYKNEISSDGFSYDDVYVKNKLPLLMFNKYFKKEKYVIFGGYFNKTLAFLFYNITNIINITINIGNKKFQFDIDNDKFFIDTGISVDFIQKELKKNKKFIKIRINNIDIEEELIERMSQNKIELMN